MACMGDANTNDTGVTGFTEWLRSFPVTEARQKLADLTAERDRITAQMDSITEWLALYERATASLGDDQQAATLPSVENGRERKYPGKRVAALKLLSENPGAEMEFAKIRARLIERDEMGDSDNEKHALRVALFKAYKKGEVGRPRDGVFVVRPPSSPSLLTGGTETE